MVTAAHVIPKSMRGHGDDSPVFVTGIGGAMGRANWVPVAVSETDDVGLLRINTNAKAICSDEDDATLKERQGANVVVRQQSGALKFVPVKIGSIDRRVITIFEDGKQGRLQKGMSGGLTLENGREIGLLIGVSSEDAGKPAEVRNIDYIADLIGPWIKSRVTDTKQAAEFLQVIESATGMRAERDVGQIAAIEGLVRSGGGVGGMDLQGLYLKSAALAGADVSGAILNGAQLENASFIGANASGALLDFANLRGGRLSRADLKGARLFYAVADKAVLDNSNGMQSNWFGASLRNASFVGADLRGASFMFADLTNADFSGADLRGAFMIAAIVSGAKFSGAKFENTNVTYVRGGDGVLGQKQAGGLCVSDGGMWNFNVVLVNVIPSSQFSGGKEYRRVFDERYALPPKGKGYAACGRHTILPDWYHPVWDANGTDAIMDTFGVQYDVELLGKGDRERRFISRIKEQHGR